MLVEVKLRKYSEMVELGIYLDLSAVNISKRLQCFHFNTLFLIFNSNNFFNQAFFSIGVFYFIFIKFCVQNHAVLAF